MAEIKVVTVNILSDLSRWQERRGLLVDQITALAPDVIALQEVKLPENNAQWLADQLGYPHVHLSPKTGWESQREAIALLTRLPIEAQDTLDLRYQQRVAQYIRVSLAGQPLVIANGHFFWQPGNSEPRLRQVERLLAWLYGMAGKPPLIVCGDFNGTPDTNAIQRMYADFASAFQVVHGREPDYTCPTPLPRSKTAVIRTLLGFFFLLRPRYLKMAWRGTLDYIFVDRRLQVSEARVVLNIPDPDKPHIYPSDHFGLYARLILPPGQ